MKQLDENIGTQKDLAMHRIETAKSDIKAAEILLDAGEYRSSNNRAYYGIYHAISAIHALDGKAYKKHKDSLAILISSMSRPRFFLAVWVEEYLRRRKFVMQVIMTISILQQKRKQRSKLLRQRNCWN